METMRYRENKKKSLKVPIFILLVFLIGGSAIITYAMLNEKEPIIVGNKGSLLTGDIPEVIEQNLLKLSYEDLENMYEIKDNYLKDTSNERIKSDINLPYVYLDSQELSSFNLSLNDKFTKTFESYKTSMANVEHNFTYYVSYISYHNLIDNKGILSLVVTEKIVDDNSQNESLSKKYTYNIDIITGETIKQEDIIVDMLGASYKEAIKVSIDNYIAQKQINAGDDFKYVYTGLENFYISQGKLHFMFSSGELLDKSYGELDIVITKIETVSEIKENSNEENSD